MTEIKKNTVLFVVLAVLITLNYFFAENHLENAVYIIVIASSMKFIGVTFQFIEVKNAHVIWKLLSVLFVAIYLIGVLALY